MGNDAVVKAMITISSLYIIQGEVGGFSLLLWPFSIIYLFGFCNSLNKMEI